MLADHSEISRAYRLSSSLMSFGARETYPCDTSVRPYFLHHVAAALDRLLHLHERAHAGARAVQTSAFTGTIFPRLPKGTMSLSPQNDSPRSTDCWRTTTSELPWPAIRTTSSTIGRKSAATIAITQCTTSSMAAAERTLVSEQRSTSQRCLRLETGRSTQGPSVSAQRWTRRPRHGNSRSGIG